jgi:hypothetical protein
MGRGAWGMVTGTMIFIFGLLGFVLLVVVYSWASRVIRRRKRFILKRKALKDTVGIAS